MIPASIPMFAFAALKSSRSNSSEEVSLYPPFLALQSGVLKAAVTTTGSSEGCQSSHKHARVERDCLLTIVWVLDLQLRKPARGGTGCTSEMVDDRLETRLSHVV
jgi:hypothetical protein